MNHKSLITLEGLDEIELQNLLLEIKTKLKKLKKPIRKKEPPKISNHNMSELNLSKSDLSNSENPKNSLPIKNSLNFIDLFCGAGGLSCGLELAGWNCVLGVDFDPNAINTFSKNHPNAKSFCEPIAHLTKEKLLELIGNQTIDLLAGGPPCQGFSTIGEGNPENEKNHLFKEYCRILEIIKPKFILFENVTGLVAKKNEKIIEQIFEKFHSLGYQVKIKILESQHYGVPQKRKRAIILGTNTNVALEFPTPFYDVHDENGKYIPPKNFGDALQQLSTIIDGEEVFFNHNQKQLMDRTDKLTSKRLEHIPEGRGIRYKKDEDELLPENLKLGIDWNNMKEGRLREVQFHKLSRKLPAPTINTKNWTYFHPLENRRLTLRELASIQSFPPYFIFEGTQNQVGTQIGNAVPPLMGKALGLTITEMINKISATEKSTEIYIDNYPANNTSQTLKNNSATKEKVKEEIYQARSSAFVYQDGHIDKIVKLSLEKREQNQETCSNDLV